MRPWAFVSPASRGIGFELAKRLLRTTDVPVVVTARKNVKDTRKAILEGVENVKGDRLHIVKLDVLDEKSISDAAGEVAQLFPKKDAYLHLSLCIPGILHPEKSPAQIDYELAELTFRTNTLGPMMLIKHFSPFLARKSTELSEERGLPKSSIWANMSARVGSISDNRAGGWYSYRASKAAVNQVNKSFDNYLNASAGNKVFCVGLHPGTVKTGLSKDFWATVKDDQLFSPEFAAEKLLEVINSRTADDRGKCWDWKGKEIAP